MNNKDIAAHVIMIAIAALGYILISFGIAWSGALITIGIILLTGGTLAQVDFVLLSLSKGRMNNKDIAAHVIMIAIAALGYILISFGIAWITIGIILLTGGTLAQVALVLLSLFKAIRDRTERRRSRFSKPSVTEPEGEEAA